MAAACDDGDTVACDSLSREDEAKRAWLARQDVPTWVAPAAVSPVASEVSAASTQSAADIAKQAWLAKQDTPSWGAAATTLASAASEAAQMAAACDDGDTVACDSLSREDEAKKAWLERQDVPTWGAAATTLAANAADAAEMAEMSAACEEGDQVACDSLSREEDA